MTRGDIKACQSALHLYPLPPPPISHYMYPLSSLSLSLSLCSVSFGQLSICYATRRVRILAGLRDLADPEAQRLYIYVERAVEFLAGAKILLPSVGGRGDVPVLGWWLIETWATVQGVPLPLCFIHGSGGFGEAGFAWRLSSGFAHGIDWPAGGWDS